jgi:spore coat protein CotH
MTITPRNHHTTSKDAPTRARRRTSRRLRLPQSARATTAGLLLFTGCAASSEAASADTAADSGDAAALSADTDESVTSSTNETTEVDLFDSSAVHTISVDFDQAEYDAMIETFTSTGDKDWISATVTIDGTTYENVGLRLKGNSSLFGLTADTSGNPEDLPWLIRLNKFVDGEDHQDYEDIVIRSNSTETAMNEAVAQELLSLAGLASQDPIATAFTVNGGETELRLAVENPDEEWYEDNVADEDGLLYKADSEGDYSYRGEEGESYTDVFEQEVGDDDMQPLIDFLDFLNNSDDATFAAELADQLDVEAFATYLAFQDLIGNADDINGRGNNSFLQYDTTTEQFTVVSWDLNLAFDTANVGGGAGGAGGGPPAGGPPAGGPPAGGGGAGGPGDQSNVLVDRFTANADFSAMYSGRQRQHLRSLCRSVHR